MTHSKPSYRNFKLTLEYEGTHFCGWQFQPGLRTVQGHLEEKLERIFKRKVIAHASGRTDSGVHALAQVAHFKTHTAIEPAIIYKALNGFLDRDVSVIRVEEVHHDFHSQYHVKNKTYRYTILNRESPSALWRDRAYFYPEKLNVTAMRRAAARLKGRHDFKAFESASGKLKPSPTVKNVSALTIVREGDLIHITITSDGFLHKMVRNIVGALLAVGCGTLAPDSIPQILKGKDRKLLPRTAPGHGLCLMAVRY
jgi:tRNA pseudouridine38-40 synthase